MKDKRNRKNITTENTELHRGIKGLLTGNSREALWLFIFIFCLFTVPLFAQEEPFYLRDPWEDVWDDPWDDITSDEDDLLANDTDDETDNDENEITAEDSPVTITASEPLSPERRRLEMEIRTSTLPELAAWCRSLGLSESGTRAELSRRIRQHYELPEPRLTANENRRVITIESAQVSEYFKIEVTDEEYARLRGEVSLSLIDNDTTHKITAEEILFNRTRNILTARGRVVYEQDRGGTIEIFRGENITVNLDDWSSVFLDGNSERRLDTDGTSYLFSGTVISRTGEDVTILNNATISNAYNPEALWSINASKLWLLPGSDFAIFNAVLRVGEIPLLYIPFFYYPADEMIFHPVIGFRSREGGFVQTTTYLIGRPRVNESEASSIARILGASNDMEKERQGLFLRSTGRRVVDTNTVSLKVLLDHYVNLGTYFGVDLYLPRSRSGIRNPSEFSLGLGFTRTVSLTGMGYTPFAPDYDGTSDWNHSNLFSISVPFRYRMRMQGSASTPIIARLGGLSWNLPYYSDPYVDRDFLNRSETMDWFGMMQQGAAAEGTTTENEIGSYQWHVNGHLNPPLPFLEPFVSRFSISNLSTTLSFKTIRDDLIFANNREAPGRFFYAPDKYTIYSLSSTISGTPFSIGGNNQNNRDTPAAQIEDPLRGIGRPISPWRTEESEEDAPETSSENRLVPPVLNQRFELPGIANVNFAIDYQVSPTGTSELQFMNTSWKAHEDVDWSSRQSILSSLGGNSSVNFRLNQSRGLFSNVVTFSGSGTWRDYTYVNEEADIFRRAGVIDENLIREFRRQQYRQTNYSTSYANNSTVRPFYRNTVFGQTNFQYSFRGTLVRSKRYIDGDGPELTPLWGAWVKEQTKDGEFIPGLNSHRISSNLAANVMDRQQSISASFELPPLDPLFSTNTILRFWISETRVDFRMRKPEDSEEWKYDPVHFTEILRFSNISTYTFNMVLTPEENNEITSITSSLTLWSFRASLRARKTQKPEFVPNDPADPTLGGRWEQRGEPSLNVSELALGYRRSFSNVDIIKNRMNFSLDLDTTTTFNTLQYTNSNFQFQMGFNFRVIGFMDIRLAATSENAVIWRYFKDVPGMQRLTSMYADGPQNNLLMDLLDSFNFFNLSKRQRSGFKMKRFDLGIIHYLGDWRAEFGVTMYPYMNITHAIPRYEVTSDINFLVQWRPITEIKTDVQYRGELDRWTRN